jgi:hypothetical protein
MTATLVTGCGGGGGGGGGGGASAPTAPDPPVRLSTAPNTVAQSVSLQDGRIHDYFISGTPGAQFFLSIETTPPTTELSVQVFENTLTGSSTLLDGTVAGGNPVTTPFTMTIDATDDSLIRIRIQDERQANLTLSRLQATMLRADASAVTYNNSSLSVCVHIAGDSFAGFGAFNDLATTPDRQQFVTDLYNGVNSIISPVQINIPTSPFASLSSAAVQAVEPGLVQGGRTILDNPAASGGTASSPFRWGNLGQDASGPNRNCLDVFIVQDALSGVLGFNGGTVHPASENGNLRQGGIFVGRGTSHALVFALFDPSGAPISVAALKQIFAHELCHFLSLSHTVEAGRSALPATGPLASSQSGLGFWQIEWYRNTPRSSPSDDKNGTGELEFGVPNGDEPLPDDDNLLFPVAGVSRTQLTTAQIEIIQSYLAQSEH